jgi:hypothetical protein
MAWYLNGTRIFVTGVAGGKKNTIARLQPLAGGTVFHYFGYENEVVKINALVVGDTDLSSIRSLAEDSTVYDLVYSGVSASDYRSGYINSIEYEREASVYQTIRQDLDCETPVYSVTIEMYL